MKLTVFTKDDKLRAVIAAALEVCLGLGGECILTEPGEAPCVYPNGYPRDTVCIADMDTCDAGELSALIRAIASADRTLIAIGRKKRAQYPGLEEASGEKTVYIRRPLPLEELCGAVARVREELEPPPSVKDTPPSPAPPAAVSLTYLTRSDTFLIGTEPLKLSPTEHALQLALYKKRGEPISRRELYETVWHRDADGAATNLTDVYIRYLRRKLDDRFGVRMIFTVRARGYMLK